MSPAAWPRENPLEERLLHVDPRLGRLRDGRVADLPALLEPGDLLVVNDGATLPASLRGATGGGAAVEVRLIGELSEGRYAALLFGAGDWHTRTEDRPPPPALGPGDAVTFGDDLSAAVERVSPASPRLVEIAFRERGAPLWSALYRRGRPIQYAYVAAPLEIWHTQTRYASRPLCAELPSAGRPLVWGLLLELIRRGVRVASLTHAAGISSTGEPALDALLPLPERFEIPDETVAAVREAKASGRRVVAVGTTVTRALEGSAAQNGGELRAGSGVTDLVLHPGFRPRVVDGLLTGVHDPTESHFRLLEAFAPAPLLHRANAYAEQAGYLCHEFGDSYLVLG
ncbi:S-adenosylmethionine:tRNA ribosyltransferase-isomerase [Sorangium cellulosum]|uniref:S-adenosylmethionine tRNA ribosyltransferase n=1 Tax=Sorangium cellulosum So0157-2 TaxID=1254432 RepID=S4XLF7_SORCE|nr:S-adenosylmethionine:tRNA ribosyltransferase-isomerase [Sorangium cellulosum]AGP32615.1 S-adenosylmethionine tRNA ribosyltransferase [Sorangium cellulosum So0157-2]